MQLSSEFILNTLKSKNDSVNINEQSATPIMKHILDHEYMSGKEMTTLTDLFHHILSSKFKEEKDGIYHMYHLPTPIRKWANHIHKIRVKSSECDVYDTKILDNIPVILKSSKTNKNNNLLREYYLGAKTINKLRYTIPNFMYTIGSIITQETKTNRKVFTVYEKIDGTSLEFLIKNNKITFPQFLNIFSQILIALSVAQEQYRFCHFDLHPGNIILRKEASPYTYIVVFHTSRYDITITDYTPIIIDFGMSCGLLHGVDEHTGCNYFKKFGIFPHLIQGFDMYKFLFYSHLYSKKSLKNDIKSLFNFYGKYDPYSVVTKNDNELIDITNEYVKNISFSVAGNYTPYQFLLWIISNYNPTSILKTRRNIFIPINSFKHDTVFCDLDKKKEEIQKLIQGIESYILVCHTNKTILKLTGEELLQLSDTQKDHLIQVDGVCLNKYKSIHLPSKDEIETEINSIIKLKLKSPVPSFTITFHKQLQPYLELLFTIRELKLHKKYDTYKRFIQEFTASEIYKSYQYYIVSLERCERWRESILKINSK